MNGEQNHYSIPSRESGWTTTFNFMVPYAWRPTDSSELLTRSLGLKKLPNKQQNFKISFLQINLVVTNQTTYHHTDSSTGAFTRNSWKSFF